MSARAATLADIESVHALLAEAGVHVERGSLAPRIEGPECGILISCVTQRGASDARAVEGRDGATLSWVIDGRALHLYDIAGTHGAIPALIELARAIANEQLAVALICTVYEGDPLIGLLAAANFERDWEEREVQSGSVRNLITFLRVLEDPA